MCGEGEENNVRWVSSSLFLFSFYYPILAAPLSTIGRVEEGSRHGGGDWSTSPWLFLISLWTHRYFHNRASMIKPPRPPSLLPAVKKRAILPTKHLAKQAVRACFFFTRSLANPEDFALMGSLPREPMPVRLLLLLGARAWRPCQAHEGCFPY